MPVLLFRAQSGNEKRDDDAAAAAAALGQRTTEDLPPVLSFAVILWFSESAHTHTHRLTASSRPAT